MSLGFKFWVQVILIPVLIISSIGALGATLFVYTAKAL